MSILLHLRARWALKAPAHPSASAPLSLCSVISCSGSPSLSLLSAPPPPPYSRACWICQQGPVQVLRLRFPLPSSRLFFCLGVKGRRWPSCRVCACAAEEAGRVGAITCHRVSRNMFVLTRHVQKERRAATNSLNSRSSKRRKRERAGGRIRHLLAEIFTFHLNTAASQLDLISSQSYNANE